MRDIDRVATGAFLAWCANDLEEILTMSRTSAWTLRRLPIGRVLPADFPARGLSQRHVNLTIAMMGGVVASACVSGARSDGRSAWFRGGLLAFGLHGFGHLAMSVKAHGYTTGVLTAPTFVIPTWLWGRRILTRRGLSDHDPSAVVAAFLALATIPAAHTVAHAILGEQSFLSSVDDATHEQVFPRP